MSARLTRRKLSEYAASEIAAGRDVTQMLAAYLVDTGRARELDLIVRDIETRLVAKGLVVADITSARELSDKTRRTINKFISDSYDGADVELRLAVNTSVLGGIKIKTPDAEYDGTIRRKLNNLRASKI